jgi:hypothetical protein
MGCAACRIMAHTILERSIPLRKSMTATANLAIMVQPET